MFLNMLSKFWRIPGYPDPVVLVNFGISRPSGWLPHRPGRWATRAARAVAIHVSRNVWAWAVGARAVPKLHGAFKMQFLCAPRRAVRVRTDAWLVTAQVGGALSWFAHWRLRICERPVVSCARTFWNVAVVEKAGLATREFRPVFWLTSRHAQTVLACAITNRSSVRTRSTLKAPRSLVTRSREVAAARRVAVVAAPPRGAAWTFRGWVATQVLAHVLADLSFLLHRPVRWRRERVATFDGGEVHLDWLLDRKDEFAPHGDGLHAATAVRPPSPSSPVVVLLYGVGGTRDDHYMKHLALRCQSRGWRAVALTYWRLDWNEVRDLAAALDAVRATNPSAPMFCVAHSASAFLLVQYSRSVGHSADGSRRGYSVETPRPRLGRDQRAQVPRPRR